MLNHDGILKGYVEMSLFFENQYGDDATKWPKDEIQSNPKMKYLARLLKLYWRYHERAKAHGYIGVGCISYADYYLRRYQMRLAKAI